MWGRKYVDIVKKISRKNFLIIRLTVGLAVLVAGIIFGRFYLNDVSVPTPVVGSDDIIIDNNEPTVVSPINGAPVSSTAERVVAVMIDNHGDARPQSGIASAARVVYEAPVEGGITRFMVVFSQNDEVVEVGPVRSARPYFLDWMREYGDALYLHSGGSPAALAELKNSSMFDGNEFWRGSYFWRDAVAIAPHDLYTSAAKWRQQITDYGASRANPAWEGWKFSDVAIEPTDTIIPAKSVTIKFAPNYIVRWTFDDVIWRYQRALNGQLVHTRALENVLATTIAIQIVPVKILDEAGRLEVGTVGSGEARVLRDGVLIRGSWKKDSESARTRFYDQTNNEILFASGNIWIEVVPVGTEIQVTS